MAIKFSVEQQLAIDSTGQNIIVSAGAGSGKTAVLTERIKRILLGGVKANQLLVLTFTNAAAAEMKERIIKKMAQDPILYTRTAEVDSAYITTFDSFSLSILKKYHDRLNLSRNISIIEKSVLNVYKRKVIDEIFLSYYENHDERFENMIFDFTSKNDNGLKKEMLKLAEKIELRTDKEEFLEKYIENYYNEEIFNNYYDELLQLLNEKINYIKVKLAQIQFEIEDKQFDSLHSALLPLLEAKKYDQIKANMNVKNPSFKGLEPVAKSIKDEIFNCVKSIKELCVFTNESYMKEAYFQSKQYVEIIIEILEVFYKKVNEYKFKYEAFEFIDIAKMAIKLVKENKDIKDELTEMFFEILVDEYQDTSDLQEEFISYISKNNVYMD